MHRLRLSSVVLLTGLLLTTRLAAQEVSSAQRAELERQLMKLQESVRGLPAPPRRSIATREDVEVYAKAGEWILRHNEFFKPHFVQDAGRVLQAGLDRAAKLSSGRADWGTQPGQTILAYRSRVDGSVQPYALTLPAGYDPRAAKRWPLHVVLHGRGGTLNEVSFIRQHDGKPAPAEQTWIQLDVFGRTNNAYRWAGETDVFEALADVERRYKIDSRRITLWGFSMGGAGAWHLGLHHPSRWCSVGAGAGFVDFYSYQKRTDLLPDWQHRTLRIYDAVDYALNLHNVPFITYGGELDPQLAASLTMQQRAEAVGAPLSVLIGPQMGHKFDDESLRKFMAFHAEHARAGRPAPPGRRDIQFTTCTLKYNQCEWLTIWELEQPYEPAVVRSHLEADGTLRIDTENVAALSIARGAADRVRLDGDEPIPLEPAADGLLPDVYFVRGETEWELLGYDDSLTFLENPDLQKRPHLQGPIDDAFMEPFLCVRGTGQPWSEAHQAWANWTLARFEREFDQWMRGKVPVVADVDLTDEQIAEKHLILFGDPGSNRVLARVIDQLPLTWTRDGLRIAGQSYDPATHGVALIYPNPLNPRRYVVLNSGMTMHAQDFKASNAWLFPKLGDVAVLKFEPSQDGYTETTEWGAIFDSAWQFPPSR
jgi:predicted esterase